MKLPQFEAGFDPPVWKFGLGGIVLGVALLFGSVAGAQTVTNNTSSESSSEANVSVSSGASASSQGGSVIIAGAPSRTHTTVKNTGDYTVRSAPAVQAPSFGSGHPCAMAGSVGISIIGGGVSGGTMKIDEACLLAQMGQGEAALIMIARRDKEACYALRQVGRIPANSVCEKGEQRAVAQRPAATAAIPTCPPGARWDGKGCWMPAKNRR